MTSTRGASLRLHITGAQRNLDVFEALFFKAVHFIVFAREGFDDPHGGEDFLITETISPSFLRTSREAFRMLRVYLKTTTASSGRDGERDQGEPPVDVEHHADHARRE